MRQKLEQMASSTSQVFLAMILVLSPAAVFGFDWDNIAPSIAGTSSLLFHLSIYIIDFVDWK